MILTCIGKCIEIKKKSQSPAFKDLKINDIMLFSVTTNPAGHNKTTYAKYIECANPITNKISRLSFNQIRRVLDNFEFVQEYNSDFDRIKEIINEQRKMH